MDLKRVFCVAIALVGLAVANLAAKADVTAQDILNDQKTVEDVVTNGIGPRAQRYSPLDQIDFGNVAKLVPAWSFELSGQSSGQAQNRQRSGQESQALIRDGVVYITGSDNHVWALDAKSGKEIWKYQERLPDGFEPCCGRVNRGAALYMDKIYFGTLDGWLVALEAKTGKFLWRRKIGGPGEGISITAAPLVVDGMIVTGIAGGDFGIVGRVEARDADNGDLVWSRPVIEGHMGLLKGEPSSVTGKLNESWPGESWKQGGGATGLGGTYDPDTNLLFFGTGRPMPWNSHARKGSNKWSSSRLAINPQNGEIVWGFQTTPNDGWGYGGGNEFIPFDYKADGKTIKAGATADRNGYFYVIDRTNGRFIRAAQYARGVTWAKGIDKNGRPVTVERNRPGDPRSSASGQIGNSVFTIPSFLGAKNRNPMAFSRQTGLFYIPSNEWGMNIWYHPGQYKKGAPFKGAKGLKGAGHVIKPLYEYIGSLKAIDPKTGKVIWEVRNRAPFWGGVLATGGVLIFTGTPEGYLKAFDARNGKELWKFDTGAGIIAPPISWRLDGEQYIGIASGAPDAASLWGADIAKIVKSADKGGRFWAFKLARPEAKTKPKTGGAPVAKPAPGAKVKENP